MADGSAPEALGRLRFRQMFADPLPGGNTLLSVRPFTAPEPFRRVALAWRVTYPRSGAIDVIRAAILDSPLAGVTPVGRS